MHDSESLILASPPFKIEPWTVVPRNLQIKNGEKSEKMTRKMMEMLVCLANHHGEVVSKEELMERVWSDVLVSEGTVRRTISQLRRLFEDDAAKPQFIETVPRVGYRLIAPVEASLKQSMPPEIQPLPPDGHPTLSKQPVPSNKDAHKATKPARSPLPALKWLGLAGAVVLIGIWLAYKPSIDPPPVLTPETKQVTSFHGDEIYPVLSPNGMQIAFTHVRETDGKPQADLFVKIVDADPFLQLTDDPLFETSAAWSPDGLHIAYAGLQDGACALYRISAIGGAPRKLANCSPLSDGSPPPITWSPDGRHIAFPRYDSTQNKTAVYVMELESRGETPFSTPDSSEHDVEMSFSPDAKRIAFVRRSERASAIMLRDLQAASSTPTELHAASSRLWDLHWNASGNTLYFVTDGPAQWPELWNISIAGNVKRRLSLPAEVSVGTQVSMRENRLVYTEMDIETDLWSASLEDSVSNRLRFSSTKHDLMPALDPTGTQIAFVSDRNDRVSLWIGNLEVGVALELAPVQGVDLTNLIWNEEGTRIFYGSSEGVYSVDIASGESIRMDSEPAVNLHFDSSGAVFVTRVGEAGPQISSIHDPAGMAPAAPFEPGRVLRGVASGVFYTTEATQPDRLWRRGSSEPERQPIQLDFDVNDVAPAAWAFTSSGFYYVKIADGWRLHFFDFETGSSEEVFQFPRGQIRAFSISPEGDTLFFDLEQLRGMDIKLLDEFDRGL